MLSYEELFNELAKIGYETMHEDRWDDLPLQSIERTMWLSITQNMVEKLWELHSGSAKVLA